MASLFPQERKEFFHLETAISQVWRRGDRQQRLEASHCDDLAIRALGLVSSFHGEGDVFSTRRLANLVGEFFMRLEAFPMVKKAERTSNSNAAPEWRGFLEYRLSPDELEDLDSWTPDASEIMEALHAFIVEGYTFTLSWSARTGQACFSLRDNNPERKTAGYCMTTFDADCALALKAGVYKQKVVLRDDWQPLLVPGKAVRRG